MEDQDWQDYCDSLRKFGWAEERVEKIQAERNTPERQEDFQAFLELRARGLNP